MAMPDIPMYVFTGFLESGKTKFIQETLEDERFNTGERTLLLVFEEGEDAEEYAPMIQSLVTDNVALMRANPDYLKQLDSLPPKLKAAWRYGDWNVFEGQFFEEFVNNPEAEGNRWTHVIHPFAIPKGWRIYRSYDYGYQALFLRLVGGGSRRVLLPHFGVLRLERAAQRGREAPGAQAV